MNKPKRLYRVLKRLSLGEEMVELGAVVDLGHLDVIQLQKLEWKRAVEALPNIPKTEVTKDES